jgi:hypothetical protein
MNLRPRWLKVVATAPFWPWAWLICFAVVARVKLGFWPQYDRPDPKDLHLPWLDMPPLVLFALAPVAFLISLIVVGRRWINGNRDWSTFLIAIFSFVVFVLWFWRDPGGLFEWWID